MDLSCEVPSQGPQLALVGTGLWPAGHHSMLRVLPEEIYTLKGKSCSHKAPTVVQGHRATWKSIF